MLTWEEIWPPYGLTIRCGELTLSPVREADIPALAASAAGGVSTPGTVAFPTYWDVGSDVEVARRTASYHWASRANFDPQDWIVEFTVRRGNHVVGVQGSRAHDYLALRQIGSGSWLAKSQQGHGIGTLMRQMIAVAFFDYFGAQEMTSAADVNNLASIRVSEKVGYQRNGSERVAAKDGTVTTQIRFVLTPESLVRPDLPVEVTGAEAFRTFLGLAASSA